MNKWRKYKEWIRKMKVILKCREKVKWRKMRISRNALKEWNNERLKQWETEEMQRNEVTKTMNEWET